MSQPAAITDADFAAKVLKSPRPVVVDFWAEWCSPCKQLAPIIDQLADAFDGQIDFVKIDTDNNLKTAAQFRVMKLPTVLVMSGGEVVKEFRNGVTKMQMRKALEEIG